MGNSASALHQVAGLGVVFWLICLSLFPGLPGHLPGGAMLYPAMGWVLCAALVIAEAATGGWRRHNPIALLCGCGLFVTLIVQTFLISRGQVTPLISAFMLWLAGCCFTPALGRAFLRALCWSGVLVCLACVLDWLGILPGILAGAWRDQTHFINETVRLSGNAFHPNLLAYYLLVCWFAGLWVIRSAKKEWIIGILAVNSFFLIGLMSITYSRGVMLGGVMLCLFGILFWGRRIFNHPVRIYWVAGFSGLLIFMAIRSGDWMHRMEQSAQQAEQAVETIQREEKIPSYLQFAYGWIPASPKEPPSEIGKIGRVDMLKEAWKIGSANPAFGLGAGAFYRFGRGHLHAHNVFAELFVSGGLLALLSGIGLLIYSYTGLRLRWWHGLIIMPFFTGLFDCFLFFKIPLFQTSLALGLGLSFAAATNRALTIPATAAATGQADPNALIDRLIGGMTAVAVLAFLVVVAVYKSLPIDFYSYYVAAQFAAETGGHPYLPWPAGSLVVPVETQLGAFAQGAHGLLPLRFFYPPTALLFFQPLGLIPNAHFAAFCWFLLELLSIWLMCAGVMRMSKETPLWLIILAVIAHLPVLSSLRYGQVSLPLAAAAVWVWVWHTEGKSARAGALLAAAAAVKIFPVFWVVMLLLRPQGALRFLGAALSAGIGLVALSAAVYGYDYWEAYVTDVLLTLSAHPPGGANASLHGTLMTIFSHWVSLLRLIGIVGIATVWIAGVGRFIDQGGQRELVPLFLTGGLALGLLASPVAWTHYACILTPFLVSTIGEQLKKGFLTSSFLALAIMLLTGMESLVSGILNSEHTALFVSAGFVLAVASPWLSYYVDRLLIRENTPQTAPSLAATPAPHT